VVSCPRRRERHGQHTNRPRASGQGTELGPRVESRIPCVWIHWDSVACILPGALHQVGRWWAAVSGTVTLPRR
jgi:hypothetical protein